MKLTLKQANKTVDGTITGTPQDTTLVINNATDEVMNMILFGATIEIDGQVIRDYHVHSSNLKDGTLTVKMNIK